MLLTLVYFAVVSAGAILTLYLLVAGRGYILRYQVAGAGLAVMLWGLWSLLGPSAAAPDAVNGSSIAEQGAFFADLVLLIAWYRLVERLLRGPYQQSLPGAVRSGLRWIWLVVLLTVWLAVAGQPWLEGYIAIQDLLLLALLSLSLLAQALTAQCYGDAIVEPFPRLRNLSAAATLALTGLVLSSGVGLLVEFVPLWVQVIRAIALLASLFLLAGSVQGNPQWALAIFVSPQARHYVPRVLCAAAVLALIVIFVPLFRNTDLARNSSLAALLIISVIAVLLVVLFSERVRAQLGVYGSKRFLPFRYDYRGEWLRLIDTLASPEQARPLPERAILALAQIVSSPAGALWLHDSENGHFECVEAWNTRKLSEVRVAVTDPAVEYMRLRHWILDTVEWQRRPELYPGLARPDWLRYFPDAVLIVPLLSGDSALGFVMLVQPSSKFRLTFEEIDLLRTSGRQIAAHLAQYQADRQLAQSKQFEAFNRLTAFVMHDLKNLIAQQSLMVKNASKHKDNPEFFRDSMATIENSVARMQKLLQQLQTGESMGPARIVAIETCVREAIAKCAGRHPEPRFAGASENIQISIDAEHFTSILAHLIRNAQDATDANGDVSIELYKDNDMAKILVNDNGCGMDEEFIRSRLFRPFDTTKGSQGMGIGAYQARSFVVAAGGTLVVRSAAGDGTSIEIRLPTVAANLTAEVE